MLSGIQRVECFHLVVLRVLEARLDRTTWVVKGGVNLRAWFGSLRYSEDLDVDLIRGGVRTVQARVDGAIGSATLRDTLAAQGLELVRVSKPKQTETTQRWKFELQARGFSVPLHTRIEFSRRGEDEGYALEPVRSEVARPYGLLPPMVNHYTARSAMRQKLRALASRREPQARDVWDLEHLLRTTGASLAPLSAAEVEVARRALDRAMDLSFDVYRAQVVPFLAPEHQRDYATEDVWTRICEAVVDRVSESLP